MARIHTGIVAAALATCAGCDDRKAAGPAAANPMAAARTAALQSVAATPGLPRTVQFRGVQAYTQAIAGQIAVCGQLTAFGDDPAVFVPFVTVARQRTVPGAATPRYEFISDIGLTADRATHVYAALVAYCWDGGGLVPDQLAPVPPLPENVPAPRMVSDSGAASAGPLAPSATTVTARQGANLRSTPAGAVIGHVARGSVLTVFAQAQGGWYQVGTGSPSGWMHESVLQR